MKLKVLLILMLAAVTFTSYAQDGGIRGKVVSRNGRVALSLSLIHISEPTRP